MAQHIIVKPYNPLWIKEFNKEKAKIEDILQDNALSIYHIGSTSVPNLPAKPIIDIMVAVRSLDAVDSIAVSFEDIGYEYLGEFGIKGRRYLRKGGDERTHQIHIFKYDDLANITRHLAFRDYLIKHDDVKDKYAELKIRLAEKFPYDIEGYSDGKDDFVKRVEAEALKEYDSSWDKLYLNARAVQYERDISDLIEAGVVSSALLSGKGNIYLGVSIDTACSLGLCAERNAIANMITCGENKIKKIVAVKEGGAVIMPCGVCREMMMQLGLSSADIEILIDYEKKKSIRLKDLIPSWWA